MVVLAMVWGVPPATAQMSPEEEQRCVWQCLANSPGAASAEYNSCVQERCVAQPRAEQPPVSPTPRAAWTSGAGKGGAHYAGVEIPGKSFSYLCKRGGLRSPLLSVDTGGGVEPGSTPPCAAWLKPL